MKIGRRVFAGMATSAAILSHARADGFPSKPIRILVPFTPGGTTDILAREIAAKLQIAFNQSVIVEWSPTG